MRTKELQDATSMGLIDHYCLLELEKMHPDLQAYVAGQLLEMLNIKPQYTFYLEKYYHHTVDDKRGLHNFVFGIPGIGLVEKEFTKVFNEYAYQLRSLFSEGGDMYCTTPHAIGLDNLELVVLYEA